MTSQVFCNKTDCKHNELATLPPHERVCSKELIFFKFFLRVRGSRYPDLALCDDYEERELKNQKAVELEKENRKVKTA